VRHFRENWQPALTDRKTYETWKSQGAASMEQRARQKVKHILEHHQPPPLPVEVDAQIDKILARQ